ncbi:MAG: MBL fold metallo-hydrolase [Coriobacteriales bacterium]|jgi:phosphoribosyl 1,2-cyclic phosphate phosphodiesterase
MRWFDANAQLGENAGFERTGNTTLVFLGTGASCGVPIYYCDCKACREAEKNPMARRTCSSIAIVRDEVTLIDTAPEIHHQLSREHISDVHRVLFTHEHLDHTGGVPQLEYMIRLRRHVPIDFYCNGHTADYIESHFEMMDDISNIHRIEYGHQMEFDGISYTSISASHCPGAFGYLIEIPAECTSDEKARRIAYLPDTSRPSDDVLDIIRGVDVLIIDGTFNDGNWMPSQHMEIDASVALADELEVGSAYLTHLSMHFDEPITLEELNAKLEGSRTHASYDGLRLNF